MKEEIFDIILLFIGLALIAFGLYHIKPNEEPQQIVVDHYIDRIKTDTVWIDHYDTLIYYHQDTVWENGEIVIVEDTVEVPVPISNHLFDTILCQGDTIKTEIKGFLSGYKPSLEQLSVHTEIMQQRPNFKPSRWSIGVQLGYGLTPKGFQPYLGLGIGYKIKADR